MIEFKKVNIARLIQITTVCAAFFSAPGPVPALADGLDWSVVNPFRFYRHERDFQPHRDAYDRAVNAVGPNATDLIARIERDLNLPDCDNPANPERCWETQRDQFAARRRGWAAKSFTSDDTCYNRDPPEGPPHYESTCKRSYSWGDVTEDYILPKSHAVRVGLLDSDAKRFSGKLCDWDWTPRSADVVPPTGIDCKNSITIRSVPYPDGVIVTVKIPEGQPISEKISVEDLLIVGLGDSFAAGEGNPDRPIEISSRNWSIVYSDESRAASKALPMRATEGDSKPISETARRRDGEDIDPIAVLYDKDRFFAAAADWLSADCHRSQYSYQFRIALHLALKDKRRAVTLVHLACTGAEITEGLFTSKEAREHLRAAKVVPSQFDQLLDLVCEERAQPVYMNGATGEQHPGSPTFEYSMLAPKYYGRLTLEPRTFFVTGCKGGKLKRPIDLVLLTFGGNDIGFSALVGYSIMSSSAAMAPIAKAYELLTGQSVIYGVPPAQRYLGVLDVRYAAVKKALKELLKISPNRVIQTSYAPLQYDSDGSLCTGNAGLDVHEKFGFIRSRLSQVSSFSNRLLDRLECITDVDASPNGKACPKTLATSKGTGFRLVEFYDEFSKRGVCAADASTVEAHYMHMPTEAAGEFLLWQPYLFHPYAERRRLIVSPNDAFLTANTHMDGTAAPDFDDVLNLGTAALYSGAFHPNAGGQAIIADKGMSKVLDALKSPR